MQVVTFETAKRLKEAGFPNPEILNNRFWFITDHEKPLFVEYSENILECIRMKFNPIFAPSATDILKELGSEWALKCTMFNIWVCYHSFNVEALKYANNSPAEACAAAWLAKNEKP